MWESKTVQILLIGLGLVWVALAGSVINTWYEDWIHHAYPDYATRGQVNAFLFVMTILIAAITLWITNLQQLHFFMQLKPFMANDSLSTLPISYFQTPGLRAGKKEDTLYQSSPV